MSDLQDESAIQSATETLEEWEWVLTGSVTFGLTEAQRRMLLLASKVGNISMAVIKEVGQMYGITITGIQFLFRPAFFGFSHFGIDRIASPASFSTLYIYAGSPNETIRGEFEDQLARRVLANYIVYFIYGGP
jgi:hypothetical protein